MTRAKLLRDINYALNHIQYGEEKEKKVKKAFKKLKEDLKLLKALQKENQELKSSYESLKKDYWELDKVEEDILQKFLLQGQVISAIQDEIVKKIETETIYEDVSPLCEVTISINKKIFDMLFEKKEVLEDGR